ncbi:MAG: hypothetical protein RSE47_02025, partial [Acidaminococcaceae bacterium]
RRPVVKAATPVLVVMAVLLATAVLLGHLAQALFRANLAQLAQPVQPVLVVTRGQTKLAALLQLME